jgi:hypothetical protein
MRTHPKREKTKRKKTGNRQQLRNPNQRKRRQAPVTLTRRLTEKF